MLSEQKDCSGLTSFLDRTQSIDLGVKQSTGLNKILVAPEAFKESAPTVQPDVQEGIVAFLDVLGTSSLMESIDNEGIRKEDIQRVYLTTIGMQDAFINSIQNMQEKLANELKYMIISDSFVISVPSTQNAIITLIQFIANFQKTCLKSFSQLLRGAVAKGKVIGNITENKIIGSAFIKAHRAEGKLAVYPRIILDNQLVDEFELDKTLGIRNFITIDADGMFYVNFADRMLDEEISTIVKMVSQKEKLFSPECQKWNWLCNYLQKKLSVPTKNY